MRNLRIFNNFVHLRKAKTAQHFSPCALRYKPK